MWSLLRGPGLGGWKKQGTEHHGGSAKASPLQSTGSVLGAPCRLSGLILTTAHSTERKTEAQRG